MANNNFPPGMPFPFPFPHMQPLPHAPHPEGQQQQQQHQHQHAPPPPPGWNLPGLHQPYPPQPYAPQPGHAENQHSLPPFPSAAMSWPPQIPPEWLQMMQSSMQNGMIPPPLPGLSFPSPSLPHTPQAPATPLAMSSQYPPQPIAAPVERVQEVLDSDREDGEVSDAGAGSQTAAGMPMRQRYPQPPRSAPQPAAAPPHAEDAYNPDRPAAGQRTPQAPTPKVAPPATAVANDVDLVQQQREEAKQFIRLLNSNNIGYRALAKENIDVELLRGMYRSMNLPSEPEPIPPPKTNGTVVPKPLADSQATTTPSAPHKTVPAVSTNIAAASAPSAAASPVDRKDYLARLQAAKLSRKSGPPKASPPQKSPPVSVASPATGISTPQATMTPTRKPPVTDEQKARQTELIKQRLEALKAQSKPTVISSSSIAQKPGPSQSSFQQAPATSTPAPQTPASAFQGIPGLFMNASNTGNGTSTPSRQPQAIPHKRPAPSDTSLSTPRGSVTPYNRTFGQSPHAQQDDSMIIEVSDDESNGSDMDIDDDQAPLDSSAIRQAPVSIPGFPPRQAPVPAAPSAVSTPGPQTPASLARTGELNTKEQELAALKQTLRKKLAEQKRIKEAEAATAAASAAATSIASSQETPSKQHQASSSLAVAAHQSHAGTQSQQNSAPAPAHATTSFGDSSRDRKRRRRTEIQEQLPSLDDEIASNEAEMARLAKDLERLKANNDRIMQDKQRLTKELEDLGIDTEGMSHADMRATKDEIERAMSPEVETMPQIANALPQAVPRHERSDGLATAERAKTTATEPTSLHAPTSVSTQPNPTQFGFLPGLGQAAPSAPAFTTPRSTPHHTQEQTKGSSPDLQPTFEIREPVEAPKLAVTVNDRAASATPMDDDDEDFYSPPPPAEVGGTIEPIAVEVPEPQADQSLANAPSPSEEGEVEMSVSSEDEDDEEEYEPEEPVLDVPAVDQHVMDPSRHVQLPEPQVEQSQSVRQSQVSTEDEEAYEPPDVDEEMADVAPVAENGQPEVSSPGDADDGAMDIATSSSDISDDSDSDSDDESQSEFDDLKSQTQVAQQNTNFADDLAPELQPQPTIVTVPVSEQPENLHTVEEEPKPASFTPYESPLRVFKSYRYHPNFTQDVDGGYLSMTYSHQIDPEKPLCPFESAGGSCNDPECPNQHFRGMGITGEKLLVQLGTANPGKTQDEKQQWNDGLRSVLKDLRQRNIKDPNGIAREIAKYRRQFLNDDTRVVNL